MTNAVPIFLVIAIFIIVVAVLLTWAFRKTIKHDKQVEDLNGNQQDGDASATWIGIDEGDHR